MTRIKRKRTEAIDKQRSFYFPICEIRVIRGSVSVKLKKVIQVIVDRHYTLLVRKPLGDADRTNRKTFAVAGRVLHANRVRRRIEQGFVRSRDRTGAEAR